MKEEIAKLWVEALRSGKYEQTQGRLKNEDGFCCLGVLCDISGLGEWGIGASGGEEFRIGSDPEQCEGGVPPISVQKWSGLRSKNGAISSDRCLSQLNDDGKTFEEIADIIEK